MTADDSTSDEVLTAIRQIVRRISAHSRYLSKEVGLTVPQLICIKSIGNGEGADSMTVARVAKEVQLSSATVSRVVDRLVKRGLVLRERGVTDRRTVRLSLTSVGHARYLDLPKPLQDEFLDRLAALPKAERETILGALKKTAELMDATDLDAAPLLVPGENIKTEPG